MFRNLLKNTDYILLGTVLILFIIGVFGIYSAGYNTDVNKDEYVKQIIWFSVSCILMIIIWAFDYKIFDIFGYALYGLNLILLILVLFMPKLMGASSWFNFGAFLYQPSELMKIGYIICAAKFISIYEGINKNDKKKLASLLKNIKKEGLDNKINSIAFLDNSTISMNTTRFWYCGRILSNYCLYAI